MKGKENVLAEVSLIFTAYNLRRSMSILGFEGLLRRLKAHFSIFFGNLLLKSCEDTSGKYFHSSIMMFLRTRQEYLEKKKYKKWC